MGKATGLGDALYVAGRDLSGDTQALGAIGGGPAALDVTGINKSAYERIGGLRDGRIEWTSFFNDATGAAHPTLKTLPTSDVQILYCRGTTLGNPAAGMVAKQVNYDGSRGADGMFTFALQAQSNGYGLEWGRLLTAGSATQTGASGSGTSIDLGTGTVSFGGQMYLQVTDFTGTDITFGVETSSDNGAGDAFAGIGSLEQQVTTANTTFRTATSSSQAIERYARYYWYTSGGFTTCTFAIMFTRNDTATVF